MLLPKLMLFCPQCPSSNIGQYMPRKWTINLLQFLVPQAHLLARAPVVSVYFDTSTDDTSLVPGPSWGGGAWDKAMMIQ